MLRAGAYYIHLMKKISGIDFENLERKDMRSGAYSNLVPVVRSRLQLAAGPSCWREWRRAADLAGPRAVVKFTLPGPMTMADGMVNLHYEDEAALATDLISCIKAELAGLVEAGCRHVQIDEPVMMRWGVRMMMMIMMMMVGILSVPWPPGWTTWPGAWRGCPTPSPR